MADKNSFKSVLGYNRHIFSYFQGRIKKQNEVLQSIKSILPPSLSIHVHYCVLAEKNIFLYTDSAIWASQLRFYQQQLLESLLSDNKRSFEAIKIKVIPKKIEIKPVITEQQLPSKKNVFLILDQAENQSDEKLKQALFKLGNTLRKKQPF